MRLISCHVENFGKLSDFSMDFTPGANVIYEESYVLWLFRRA